MRRRDVLLIVDNTFATPFFQRPFEFGADIVYHSTTKYLNGHSDMIGGMALLNDDDLAERLGFIQQGEQVSTRELDDMLRQYVEPLEVEVFHYSRKWLQKMAARNMDF